MDESRVVKIGYAAAAILLWIAEKDAVENP